MAMGWVEDVRQSAIIDEAEQLATRYLLPEFADVRAIYAAIGFDAQAFAEGLLADAKAGRDARSGSAVTQAGYEVESAQSRDVVTESRTWFEQLRLAGRYATATGHPLAPYVDRLAAARDLAPESWSRARDSLDACLKFLRTANLQGSGLPADFVARGEGLVARLDKERTDASAPWLGRADQSERLQQILDRIVASFEKVSAARDLAMAITGKKIPGLEFSLVRGAAGGSTSAAPAAAPAAPAAPGAEGSGDAGL